MISEALKIIDQFLIATKDRNLIPQDEVQDFVLDLRFALQEETLGV
jgi:hypothetical protein